MLSTKDLEEPPAPPKLIVSNLCDRVQPHHLTRLFSQVGPVSKITLQFDSEGRRTGCAEVTMENKDHAMAVVKEFNGASLDEYPMEIVLVEDKPKPVYVERRREPSPPRRRSHPHPDELQYRSHRREPPRRDEREEPPKKAPRQASMRVVSKAFVPKSNFTIEVENNKFRSEKKPRAFKERRGAKRGRGRGRGRGGARGGAPKQKRQPKSQEELDAELNAYFDSEKKETKNDEES